MNKLHEVLLKPFYSKAVFATKANYIDFTIHEELESQERHWIREEMKKIKFSFQMIDKLSRINETPSKNNNPRDPSLDEFHWLKMKRYLESFSSCN